MNDMQTLIASISILGLLGLIAGTLLATASKIFAVKTDPRIEQVESLLPGSNCGACGYAGCRAYAEALIGGTDPTLCKPGGEETVKQIAEIVGIKEFEITKEKAIILCGAGKELCVGRSEYNGERTCKAETNISGGGSACTYGCLSHGDCALVCPVDAIKVNPSLPPTIDREKCVGCGKCVDACPRNLIILEDENHKTFVLCKSNDKGAVVRKICKVGCIACRICVKQCPEGTMTMEGRIPVVHYEVGEPTEECIKKCPAKTIVKY
jgi:Na+-translocating ferredoxin:NAD+ oxidoreductase RNF subunit RnfB